MAEKLTNSPEVQRPSVEIQAERPKAAEFTAADQAEQIEKAQSEVAAEASHSERPHQPQLPPEDDRPLLIDNAVKNYRMRKNLAHIQSKLQPNQRSFSKVVHQPLVQKVSDSAAKTIARPSGVLGGGIFAFIGSSVYLYLARSADIRYNFLFFLGFFVGGFVLGLAVEYGYSWLRKLYNR